MPPRRPARSKAPIPISGAAPAHEALVYPAATGKISRLAALAPELFHEILSHLKVLPLSLNYDVLPACGFLALHPFAERNETLRALSQTCRALRKCAHLLLWERLDCVLVPELKGGVWCKYIMAKIQRFSKGLADTPSLRAYVRSISFSVTSSQTEETLACLASLLPTLPSLRTIQVLGCIQPGKLSAAVKGLSLESVRVVAVGSDAHALVGCSPHATHVRCTGATNPALLSALSGCTSLERFDGMFDWSEPKNTLELVKTAPNLKHLELRHVSRKHDAVAEWTAACIPQLSKLPQLCSLTLTFAVPNAQYPDAERDAAAQKTYVKVADEARKLMLALAKRTGGSGPGRRRLIIRHVKPPRYDNSLLEDFVKECSVEVFE